MTQTVCRRARPATEDSLKIPEPIELNTTGEACFGHRQQDATERKGIRRGVAGRKKKKAFRASKRKGETGRKAVCGCRGSRVTP